MYKKKILIIVLEYNNCKYTIDTINTIYSSSWDDEDFDILLIDNSTDVKNSEILQDEVQKLQKESVLYVKNPVNNGYAWWNNLAMKYAKDYEYLLFSNNDIEFCPSVVESLKKFLDVNSEYFAVQPKIFNFFTRKLDYAWAGWGFIDTYGYPFCNGRIFDTIEEDVEIESPEIFWASGACFMIRADIFCEVWWFDEEYFMYFEEIDLCWRLQNMWYKIWVDKNSKIYHKSVLYREKWTVSFYSRFYKNFWKIFDKNYLYKDKTKILIIRYLLYIVQMFYFLMLDYKQSIGMINGYVDFLNINKWKAESLDIKPTKLYQSSIVFLYFFKSKKYFSSLNK